MNNQNLATKIKDLRNRNGFSQEQLAEESKLSLRTIQRIEHGESVPRGDTLVRLAHALGVSPYDLLDWSKIDDKGYLGILNLSALSVFYHPLLGILLPIIFWMWKKEKINLVDDSGKKLINFQITIALMLYLGLAILDLILHGTAYLPDNLDIDFINIFNALFIRFNFGGFITIAICVYNLLLVFINIYRTQKGQKCIYVPALQLLK